MKLAATLCFVLVATPAMALEGSLRVSWNACPGNAAAATGAMFDCDPQAHSRYRLFGTLTPRDPVSGVMSVDGIVDFMLRDVPVVPRFWHFESGSCNATGLAMLDVPPALGCSGARTDLCGATGGSCDAGIVAYIVGPEQGLPSNRAKLVFLLTRTIPVSLPALQQFAFELSFTMDKASPATCGGCAEVVAITWQESTLLDGTGQPLARLTSTAPGSDATAYANCQGCSIVARRGTSWGTIKALYR